MTQLVVSDLQVSWWDRFLIGLAPAWGQRRIEARARVQMIGRYYEAAQGGRRTDGWRKSSTDANAANGPSLGRLRDLSRDLRRNNGWAKRGIQAIVNNTVGWGIMPKPTGRSRARSEAALALWNSWATTTACDFDGRLNFYGIQRLAMETIAEAGEVVILRQPASMQDGLPIPMRLHVLEPDYIDTNRNGLVGVDGGPIIDGIECDKFGRRVAYWLYTSHPGGNRVASTQFESIRVPAERVIHIFRTDRPGQLRGVPWLAPAIARLKDLDDYEDAELMQQKVAACFGAFVTDIDGAASPLGGAGSDSNGQPIESLEPGHIEYLAPGKSVTFATPPRAQDAAFSNRVLRRIAVSLGVPFEELTGDYSQVNFSSARMSRLAHWQNVHEWREHMLIPQLCQGVWKWAMDLAVAMEGWPQVPAAEWAAPPMPILEPDKEGLAYQRLLRIGAMTWPQMVRELGQDPLAQLDEIQAFNIDVDERGIVLDGDPRTMTQAGQAQTLPAAPPIADAADAADAGGVDEIDAVEPDDPYNADAAARALTATPDPVAAPGQAAPGHQETPYSCGAAALSYALSAIGIEVDEEKLRELSKTTEEGADELQLGTALQELGVTYAENRTATFANLVSEVKAGHACLLCVDDWEHWVAIVGVLGSRVVFRDPTNTADNIDANTIHLLTESDLTARWRGPDDQLYMMVIVP